MSLLFTILDILDWLYPQRINNLINIYFTKTKFEPYDFKSCCNWRWHNG